MRDFGGAWRSTRILEPLARTKERNPYAYRAQVKARGVDETPQTLWTTTLAALSGASRSTRTVDVRHMASMEKDPVWMATPAASKR